MKQKSKWASRKLAIFFYVSLLFSALYVVTLFKADSIATSAFGLNAQWIIGLLGAVCMGGLAVDKLLELKNGKKDDKDTN